MNVNDGYVTGFGDYAQHLTEAEIRDAEHEPSRR